MTPQSGNWVLPSLGNSGLCWTVFARNRDTAVPAEGNGDLQTLICVLVARPRRFLALLNPVPWQNWMVAYLGYTLRMRTLFHGWPTMVNDTHTRRRRFLPIPVSFIPTPMPGKHLFLFRLFFHIDICIPDYVTLMTITFMWNNSYSTRLHCCFSNTVLWDNFNTIHRCVTEDRNKSHHVLLCERRKQVAQSVMSCDLTNLREWF